MVLQGMAGHGRAFCAAGGARSSLVVRAKRLGGAKRPKGSLKAGPGLASCWHYSSQRVRPSGRAAQPPRPPPQLSGPSSHPPSPQATLQRAARGEPLSEPVTQLLQIISFYPLHAITSYTCTLQVLQSFKTRDPAITSTTLKKYFIVNMYITGAATALQTCHPQLQ